jgi:hypothetical protein
MPPAGQHEAAADRRQAQRVEVGEQSDRLHARVDVVIDSAEVAAEKTVIGHVEIAEVAVEAQRQKAVHLGRGVNAITQGADARSDGKSVGPGRRAGQHQTR